MDPQPSRTGLGNVLLKNKRFSADGQNIAQSCTIMRVVIKTQYWTADTPSPPPPPPHKENLQPILREEIEVVVASLKKGKSAGFDNIAAKLVQLAGRP